jgi:hypothetical protein
MRATSRRETARPAVLPPPDEPVAQPQFSVLAAVRRHWLLFSLPVVLLVAAGLVLADKRPPVYTARAAMTIGGVDASQPGSLSGFAAAAPALATAYSRAITADGVVNPVATTLGISPTAVRQRVSATPIPESPVFRIDAHGSSEKAAVDLANLTAAALRPYVPRLTASTMTDTTIEDEYRRAASEYQSALAASDRAAAAYERDATRSNERKLVRRRTETDAAQLRRDALAQAYRQATASQDSVPGVRSLARATSASSDRVATFQLYGFLGLLAGGVAGAALAALRAKRVARRQRRG